MTYSREDACRAWITYAMLNPEHVEDLLREYDSYEKIYDQFVQTQGAVLLHYANDSQMEILTHQAKKETMHEMLLAMQRVGMGIIAKDDPVYPELLRHISDAPPLLFYIGNLRALSGMKYATIVGSRKASFETAEATRCVARDLSCNGVIVVSGLAVGIDAAAHEGCLEGNSPTIGVAACGLDVDYPVDNALLKRRILAKGGILLSEAPPGTPANGWRFPIRNRILSGLSQATLLMESSVQSGSMKTIDHALDQGREVYAYHNESNVPVSEGTAKITNDGATPFHTAQDVLTDMKWSGTRKTASGSRMTTKAQPPQAMLPPLTEQQQKIYDLLEDGERSYDQLAASSGYDAQTLSGILTMLQIYGLIRSLPGKQYKRN